MDKKEFFKARIDKIAKESFNAEQKEIAKKIIDNAKDEDLDAVWGLVSQRVKTGFVFDEAPEINHNCVAYLIENEKLNININNKDTTEHSLIIGENYDALKNLLAVYIDKNGKGLIDVIYIDPPYNTDKSKEEGNDYKEEIEGKNKFIYRDKYTRDGWLNMMNERLKLAKRLLSDKGVIFISIDDSEQAYLKILCDEIFGEENFVSLLSIENNPKGRKNQQFVSVCNDYCLIYAKNKSNSYFLENIPKDKKSMVLDENGIPVHNSGKRVLVGEGDFNPVVKEMKSKKHYSVYYNFLNDDIVFKKETSVSDIDKDLIDEGYERFISFNNDYFIENTYTQDKLYELFEDGCLDFKGKKIYEKNFSNKIRIKSIVSNRKYDVYLDDGSIGQYNLDVKTTSAIQELKLIFNTKKTVFDHPKNKGLLKLLITLLENRDAIILDFFAGSGTTGQAVMELNEEDGGNRKFILVTNNENNIATKVTRERLYRVINGKGSKGEDIEWSYSKDKKCLNNNSVRIFDIKKESLNITEVDKAEKIKEIAEANFKKLNPNYNKNGDLNIYNVLASLTSYKEESEE